MNECYDMRFDHPATHFVCGPTGSGKTFRTANILTNVVSRPRGRNKVCRHKTQDGCRLLYSVSERRLKGKSMERQQTAWIGLERFVYAGTEGLGGRDHFSLKVFFF